MLKQIKRILLVCLVLTAAGVLYAPGAKAIPADKSYIVRVDQTNQIVTTYRGGTKEKNIVRQMLCSTGKRASAPRPTALTA